MNHSTIVQCSQLAFYFGEENIFKSINLDLELGEVLSVIGPNGGGKSTFVKIIAGLSTGNGHYTGSLLINAKQRSKLRPNHFAIGYLPQKENLNLNIPIKAKEVLQVPHSKTLPNSNYRGRSFENDEIIQLLGIGKLLELDFRQLSGGQRQRVMIARALMVESPLLIFDEPAKGLDSEGQERLEKVVRIISNQKKQSLILVDHNIQRAIALSDKILCLNRTSHWHDRKDLIDQKIINHIYECEIDHLLDASRGGAR